MRKRSKVFLDTNVLVYALDGRFPKKQQTAIECIGNPSYDVFVSTQVLQELYHTLTRKLNCAPLEARRLVSTFGGGNVVVISQPMVFAAIDTSVLSQITIWDALIVEAACNARCPRVLTEDLSHGQVIRDVVVENPFL